MIGYNLKDCSVVPHTSKSQPRCSLCSCFLILSSMTDIRRWNLSQQLHMTRNLLSWPAASILGTNWEVQRPSLLPPTLPHRKCSFN